MTDMLCAPAMVAEVDPSDSPEAQLPGPARRLGPLRRRGHGEDAVRTNGARCEPRDVRRSPMARAEARTAVGVLGRGAPARRRRARDRGRAPGLRLGVDGGGLRVRRPHPPGLVGGGNHQGPAGHGPVPALGPDPHGHGHGGAHARPPVRRPLRPRARRVGPPGRRGLVRPALPQAAGPDPRVRLHRPQGPRPRGAGHQRRTPLPLPYPGGTGLGKALKPIVHPLRERHPDRPRGGGPEERGAGGRDRRRLVPDLLLPQPHGRVRLLPRGGIRPARCPALALRTSRSSPSARRWWTTTWSRPPTCTGPCSPSTSAAWGRGT